jgi:hypothetical protein
MFVYTEDKVMRYFMAHTVRVLAHCRAYRHMLPTEWPTEQEAVKWLRMVLDSELEA